MNHIVKVLVNFSEKILALYIPIDVTKMFKTFLNQLKNTKNLKAALEAHIDAKALASELSMIERIERSRLHYEALNARENDMLTERLNRSNQGGKSMKPKQHRNGKTQKKRQRKNQKK